jgi:hypothetical protein
MSCSWLSEALNTLPIKESIRDDILMEAKLDSATEQETPLSSTDILVPVSLNQQENKTLQNWAHIESCKPKRYFEPETVEDIEVIVEQCRSNNWKLRVFGAGK